VVVGEGRSLGGGTAGPAVGIADAGVESSSRRASDGGQERWVFGRGRPSGCMGRLVGWDLDRRRERGCVGVLAGGFREGGGIVGRFDRRWLERVMSCLELRVASSSRLLDEMVIWRKDMSRSTGMGEKGAPDEMRRLLVGTTTEDPLQTYAP